MRGQIDLVAHVASRAQELVMQHFTQCLDAFRCQGDTQAVLAEQRARKQALVEVSFDVRPAPLNRVWGALIEQHNQLLEDSQISLVLE